MRKQGIKADEDIFLALMNGYMNMGLDNKGISLYHSMKDLGIEMNEKIYLALVKGIH